MTIQLHTILSLTILDVRGGGVVVHIIFEFGDDLELGQPHKFLMHKSHCGSEKHGFSLILVSQGVN